MTALAISLALVAAIAGVVAVAALLALRHVRAEAARDAAALHERLEALETRLRAPAAAPVVRTPQEYVITRLGEPEPDTTPVPVRLTGPGFADAVLRETVVHAASLASGVRRALAPETRHRILFEMRREVKRSRKARKAERREALREYRARRRAQVSVDLSATEGAA